MRIFPWFLNPWAEVRRLKAQLRRSHCAEENAWIAARCCSDAEDKLFAENADLKRRIAELTNACNERGEMLNEIHRQVIQLNADAERIHDPA